MSKFGTGQNSGQQEGAGEIFKYTVNDTPKFKFAGVDV
eukprot:SAG31_NODE_1789_length_7236_cov_7.210607_1_plen_38_part_00